MAAGVKELLKDIRELFPNFQIEESSILRPTHEFVVRFYSHFLAEFEDTISVALGISVIETNRDERLEPGKIYREISKIIHDPELKLKLSDIYNPTFVRTKSFFKICVHFYTYSYNLLGNMEQQIAETMKMKKNMDILLRRKQDLLEVISENVEKKVKYLEENEKLTERLKLLKAAHSQMEEQRAARAKNDEEVKKQIMILDQETEIERMNLKKELEERDKLAEQIVTEAEYQNIIQTVKSLESELKMLNDDQTDEDDLLSMENEVLKHLENCRKILPNVSELHCLTTVDKLLKSKEISNDLRTKLEKLSDTVNQTNLKIKQEEQRSTQVREDLRILETTSEQKKLQISEQKEKMVRENTKLRKQIRVKCSAIEKSIAETEAILKKKEDDKRKLSNCICTRFNKIVIAQENTFQKCYAFLESVNK